MRSLLTLLLVRTSGSAAATRAPQTRTLSQYTFSKHQLCRFSTASMPGTGVREFLSYFEHFWSRTTYQPMAKPRFYEIVWKTRCGASSFCELKNIVGLYYYIRSILGLYEVPFDKRVAGLAHFVSCMRPNYLSINQSKWAVCVPTTYQSINGKSHAYWHWLWRKHWRSPGGCMALPMRGHENIYNIYIYICVYVCTYIYIHTRRTWQHL